MSVIWLVVWPCIAITCLIHSCFNIHALVFSLAIHRWQAGSLSASSSALIATVYSVSMFVVSLGFCAFISKETAAQKIYNMHWETHCMCSSRPFKCINIYVIIHWLLKEGVPHHLHNQILYKVSKKKKRKTRILNWVISLISIKFILVM